jgi:hypothetical protein
MTNDEIPNDQYSRLAPSRKANGSGFDIQASIVIRHDRRHSRCSAVAAVAANDIDERLILLVVFELVFVLFVFLFVIVIFVVIKVVLVVFGGQIVVLDLFPLVIF